MRNISSSVFWSAKISSAVPNPKTGLTVTLFSLRRDLTTVLIASAPTNRETATTANSRAENGTTPETEITTNVMTLVSATLLVATTTPAQTLVNVVVAAGVTTATSNATIRIAMLKSS